MPTLYRTDWTNLISKHIAKNSIVPVIHKGKLYAVTYSPISGARLIDFFEGTVHDLGNADTGSKPSAEGTPLYWKKKGSTLTLYCFFRTEADQYGVKKLDVDLEGKTATSENDRLWTITPQAGSDLNTHESAKLPPRLAVLVEAGGGYIHYLDLEDGSDDVWDSGFGSYNARTSYKVVVKKDDIYMLCGRHLSGSNQLMLKVYAKSFTDLNLSFGGASPHPWIGGEYLAGKKHFIMTSHCQVVNTDNDIGVLDENFSQIGRIDTSAVTGWSNNDTQPGFVILGQLSNGNYASLLAVQNNREHDATAWRLYYVELAPEDATNPFSIVSSSLLLELTDTTENNEIGEALRYRRLCMCGSLSDQYGKPIVDVYNKIVYTMFGGEGNSTGKDWGFLVYIDISDLDIVEWNQFLWLINY